MEDKIVIECNYCRDFIGIDAFREVGSDIEKTRLRMFTESIRLRDESVRKALIELGWTPPQDDNKELKERK